MLKVLGAGIGILAMLAVAVTIAGMFIPREHSFSRSVKLAQPPETVWAVVFDYAGQPAWRKDVKSVERMPDQNGRPLWKITTTHGSHGYLRTAEAVAPQRLVIDHPDEQGVSLLTWRIEIVPSDGGSRVTIHERGDFGNPYTRFMVRYVLGQTKFVDDYLTYLSQKFGGAAAIELHIPPQRGGAATKSKAKDNAEAPFDCAQGRLRSLRSAEKPGSQILHRARRICELVVQRRTA